MASDGEDDVTEEEDPWDEIEGAGLRVEALPRVVGLVDNAAEDMVEMGAADGNEDGVPDMLDDGANDAGTALGSDESGIFSFSCSFECAPTFQKLDHNQMDE